MNRRIRIAAAGALLIISPVLASCGALSNSAGASPTPHNVTNVRAASGACTPGSQSEALEPFGLKMVSAAAGWAVGQCNLSSRPSFPNGSTIQCYWPPSEFAGVLRTVDGGHTWTDVSPPSIPNRSFQRADFFLDADHAWVAEVTASATACVTSVTTFMTADGGKVWHQGGTIALRSESPTSGVFDVYGPAHGIDFIDQQHGWMLVSASAANPQPDAMVDPTSLYSTADGGNHWKLVATNPGKELLGGASGCPSGIYQPTSDAIFTSVTTGWLELACPPAGAVLRTQDGGATWTLKPLGCSNCQVWQFAYLDTTHAVVTGTQGSPVLVATTDGGATWTQRAVPKAAATFFSFIDRNDGWMVGIEQHPTSYDTVVYQTIDGGVSWSLLGKPGFATPTTSPATYFPIQDVTFVDRNTGFVVLGGEVQRQGPPNPQAPNLQILSTSDGGRNWVVVLTQVPALACTDNVSQLGPGNGSIWPAKMASPSIGWARGGLRTTDGGVQWRDVSPPALRAGANSSTYPRGYAEFYLDANHAWQAGVYASTTSCDDHVNTFGTADGGKTWQESAPIALNLPAGYQAGTLQVGFTSTMAGWLWVPAGPWSNDPFGFQASQADLYATSDGGSTWKEVVKLSTSNLYGPPKTAGSQNCPPGFGPVFFSSPSVGWLSPYCADSPTLVTHDGGLTWTPASFPVPSSAGCPCYYDQPNFLDSDHGVLVVSSQNGLEGSTVLLMTSDGGTTWRAVAQPGTGYVLLVTFVNPTDLFALVTPPGWTKLSKGGFELYRSLDGGHSWTKVQPAVPATWPPGFMQFVDLNHGFESNVNGADVLLTTIDGGRTWKSITPAIVS